MITVHFSHLYTRCFTRQLMWFVACSLIWSGITSCNRQGSNTDQQSGSYSNVLKHANQLYDSNHQLEAINYLQAASRTFQNISIEEGIERYAICYNYYYHIKHNLPKAMLYVDSMQRILNTDAKRQKHLTEYGKILFFKGDILFDQNKYNDAYYAYYQGKQIGSAALDDCTLSDYTYRMGMIMYKQENYMLAAAYFKRSFKESSSCKITFRSFYRKQELLGNTALSYSAAAKYDSALYFYHKTLSYIDHHPTRYNNVLNLFVQAKGVVYGNMADVFAEQHQYNNAADLYKKSIAINLKKGNDNHDAEYTEVKLADLYAHENQPVLLLTILKQLDKQLVTVPDMKAEASLKKLLADYYYKSGDFKQSLINYKAYHTLQDSINKANQQLKESDINEQLKRFEKDYELDNLKKHNNTQRVYLIVAVAFAVMALAMIMLILQYWLRSNKNNKTLDLLNKQINNQNTVLENALNEIKLSSQEKDRILHTVAHDLRNPIGGIASLSSTMFEDTEYNEEQHSLLKAISDTANDSLLLINELLEVTNNRGAGLFMQAVEINQLVTNCLDLLNYKAAEKNLRINVSLLEQPLEIWISREKIWRVLSNLISNSIKFSQVNSVINVVLNLQHDVVQISVHDNGIGIPPDIEAKVFNMFTEAKRPGTLGEKSFGLGLSICKQIVEQHNGRIWFDSEHNEGTAFHFTIPVK